MTTEKRRAWRRGVVGAGGALFATALMAAPGAAQGWTVENLHPHGAALSSALGAAGGFQVGKARFGGIEGADHAARWDGSAGTFLDLNPVWASESTALGAARGQTVGYAVRNGVFSATLWLSTGQVVLLHPAGAASSTALATDGATQAGWAKLSAVDHAVLWAGSSSGYVDLRPAGSAESQATGVDGGVQSGWARIGGTARAGYWTGTAASFVDLHPAGAFASKANDVEGGEIVGSATFAGGTEAALWTTTSAAFVSLNPPGATDSIAFGVSGGMQVGVVQNRAALWRGSAMSHFDLHSLLPPEFFFSTAYAISVNSGGAWIAGHGVNTSTGRIEALLWRYERPTYTLTDLGALGGAQSEAYALNDAREVVGAAQTAGGVLRAFVWRDGAMTELPTPAGTASAPSSARDINNQGEATGHVLTAEGQRGLYWHEDIKGNDALTVLDAFDAAHTVALAMSDNPEFASFKIVGYAVLADGSVNGFRWTGGEAYYNFTNEFYPTVYAHTEAQGVARLSSSRTCGSTFERTPTGLISRALLWYGSYNDLGTLRAAGAGSAGAIGMNYFHDVVGWAEIDGPPAGPGGRRGFLAPINTPMFDLGALGGVESRGVRVNDQMHVVGWWLDGAGVQRGLVWEQGAVFDLTGSVNAPGWRIAEARDINESGDIVGVGFSPTGTKRAVLLTRQP